MILQYVINGGQGQQGQQGCQCQPPDLSGYATEEWVRERIGEIEHPEGAGQSLSAGERVTIDGEGRIHADKQLKLVDEQSNAVVIGGEEAGNGFIEGEGNIKGTGSLIEGRGNNAGYANCIHVEGKDNGAYGMGSHTEGTRNHVTGNFSHVEGCGHIVEGKMMHVFGRNSYPVEGSGIFISASSNNPCDAYEDCVEVVGNGADGNINRRSNARMLKWNGDEWLAGSLYVGSNSGRFPDEGTRKVATEEFAAAKAESAIRVLAVQPTHTPEEGQAFIFMRHESAGTRTVSSVISAFETPPDGMAAYGNPIRSVGPENQNAALLTATPENRQYVVVDGAEISFDSIVVNWSMSSKYRLSITGNGHTITLTGYETLDDIDFEVRLCSPDWVDEDVLVACYNDGGVVRSARMADAGSLHAGLSLLALRCSELERRLDALQNP